MDKKFRTLQRRKRKCLAPNAPQDCAGQIVKAHSIRRGRDLKRVAKDGHVIGLTSKPMTSVSSPDEAMQFGSIGINQASVFMGFCSKHDNDIFKDIELNAFEATDRHVGLVTYRNVCREFFQKMDFDAFGELLGELDAGQPIPSQVAKQQIASIFTSGLSAGHNDLGITKGALEKHLDDDEWPDLRYIVLSSCRILPLAVSTVFSPELAPDRSRIQSLEDLSQPAAQLSLTVLHEDNCSYVVASWLEHDDEVISRFIDQLLERSPDKASSILECCLLYAENIVFSPEWYNNLSATIRNAIDELAQYGVDVDKKPVPMFPKERVQFGPLPSLHVVTEKRG